MTPSVLLPNPLNPPYPDRANVPLWRSGVSHPWVFVLVLAAGLASLRALGTLGPGTWRWVLPLGFVVMAVLPWMLMTAQGRRSIGLQRARRGFYYWAAVALGASMALAVGVLGVTLFGNTADNWYVSIANAYRNTLDTRTLTWWQLHLFFTIPACIFSPIGEEIFFRGVLHRALQSRFGAQWALVCEAGLFGLVHLCHHGLWLAASGWSLRPVSGLLWVVLMFATAVLFSWLRQRCGSLGPAILAHAAFNAAMNTFIFVVLW